MHRTGLICSGFRGTAPPFPLQRIIVRGKRRRQRESNKRGRCGSTGEGRPGLETNETETHEQPTSGRPAHPIWVGSRGHCRLRHIAALGAPVGAQPKYYTA